MKLHVSLSSALAMFFLFLFAPLITISAETEKFFPGEKEKPLEYKDISRNTSGGSYKGVIFANIISVDPQYRFIFVKPKEFDLPRMFVFLDPLTDYTNSKVGFKKRSSVRRLLEGDRVAIRVFAKHGVIVADEIFYIEGEFEAPSKYEKKTYKQAPLPQNIPSASGENKGGGHH